MMPVMHHHLNGGSNGTSGTMLMVYNNNNNNNRNMQVQSPILQPGLITTKGLLNGPGQNNCFLNCAVQVNFFSFL